jgi:hypothetical protein
MERTVLGRELKNIGSISLLMMMMMMMKKKKK